MTTPDSRGLNATVADKMRHSEAGVRGEAAKDGHPRLTRRGGGMRQSEAVNQGKLRLQWSEKDILGDAKRL